jgi:Ca2+-binding RTX toxin-like protein
MLGSGSLAGRRLAAVAALMIVATMAFYSAEDAAAGENTCTYNAQARKVTATASISNSQIVVQREGDRIVVMPGDVDCGATRFQADKIVIQDVPDHDLDAFVVEVAGRLAPGHKNEPGRSDEIEIKVNLGNGSNAFDAKGDDEDTDDHLRLGTVDFKPKINLNAEEQTGIDADITITGQLDYIILEGLAGNDHIDFRGGAGTGDRYAGTGTAYAHGGDGRDVAVGRPGPDYLNGEDQKDRLEGKNGEDVLNGGNGDDYLDGGAGNDDCDPGSGTNIVLNCEES